jgi:hypothetical protein
LPALAYNGRAINGVNKMLYTNNLEDLGADVSVYSDLHKDCYGYRPRDIAFESLVDFEAEFNRLADVVLPRVMAEEAAAKVVAVEAFERSVVAVMQAVAGATRADAIRLLMDAEGVDGDVAYFEFLMGVPYGYVAGGV